MPLHRHMSFQLPPCNHLLASPIPPLKWWFEGVVLAWKKVRITSCESFAIDSNQVTRFGSYWLGLHSREEKILKMALKQYKFWPWQGSQWRKNCYNGDFLTSFLHLLRSISLHCENVQVWKICWGHFQSESYTLANLKLSADQEFCCIKILLVKQSGRVVTIFCYYTEGSQLLGFLLHIYSRLTITRFSEWGAYLWWMGRWPIILSSPLPPGGKKEKEETLAEILKNRNIFCANELECSGRYTIPPETQMPPI